jgi:hypothetical protein
MVPLYIVCHPGNQVSFYVGRVLLISARGHRPSTCSFRKEQFMASEVKKIYIISERIVNIAELEKILSRQKYVIISLHVELEKETPSIDTLRALASELQALNEKAVTFEFCLERRKSKRRVHTPLN